MTVKIFKTTTCGACQNLKHMIGDDERVTWIDIVKHPELKPEGMNGAPFVMYGDKVLTNPFEIIDLLKD